MHFFVTGHTGFKGAWLTLLLDSLGHTMTGYALDPIPGSLFERARLNDVVREDLRGDIRDADAVRRALGNAGPDVVLHLAAQPLVRESFREPRTTIETNLMGTLNLLEAVRETPSVRAHVVVTTDKVYRNDESGRAFREGDPLGGADPYSASKAMVELLVSSWAQSFDMCPTATARAGNVIGGGDVSRDRLLPDLIRAFERGEIAQVRNPSSVRPWQHALDALNGYLLLVDELVERRQSGGTWNLGPDPGDFLSVAQVADLTAAMWGGGATWERDSRPSPTEAGLLTIDSERSRTHLDWVPRLEAPAAVQWVVDWCRRTRAGESAREVSSAQIAAFLQLGSAPVRVPG
jgi:CDP-glucose 4,6-dehydratase